MKNLFLLSLFFILSLNIQAQTLVTITKGTSHTLPADFFGYNGQNVINGTQSWGSLTSHLSILQPSTLRYPGGTLGNWWDWKLGWFINDSAGRVYFTYGTDKTYLGYTYQPLDSMGIFMNNAYLNTSSPLQMLNVSTVDFSYELRWLYWMRYHNIPVKYLELGNEFYNDYLPPDNRILFPNVYYYVDAMQKWIKDIRSAFPKAQTVMMGATKTTSADPSQTSFTIANMRSYISSKSGSGYLMPDAFSLHEYPESGLSYYHMFSSGGTSFNHKLNALSNSGSKLAKAAAGIFSYVSTIPLSIQSLYGAGNTTPVLITEYNIEDNTYTICGSWLHGLYIADLTLHYLEDSVISHVYCHNIVDGAEKASLFQDTKGYDFTDVPSVDTTLATTQWALTAQGEALRLVANATKENKTAFPLSFSSSGTIHTFSSYNSIYSSQPVLYGWLFAGLNDSSAIILNLDSATFSLDIYNKLFANNGSWETIFPPKAGFNNVPYNPMLFITGNLNGDYDTTSFKGAASLHDSTGTFLSSNHIIKILPYSISYIHKSGTKLIAQASVDTACVNTTVRLSAFLSLGGADTNNVSWTNPTGITYTAIGKLQEKVTSATAGTYTFTAKYSGGSPMYNVNVTFLGRPSITISSPACGVCKNSSVTLSASGGTKYLWSPSYLLSSSSDPTSSSVTVYPQDTKTIITLDVKNGCYLDYINDTITVLPFADAGGNKTVCAGRPIRIGPLTRPPHSAPVSYKWLDDNDTTLFRTVSGLTATTKFPLQCTYTHYCMGTPTTCITYDTAVITVINCCTDSSHSGNDFFPNGVVSTSYTCRGCNSDGSDITNFPYITSSYLLGHYHHPAANILTYAHRIILNGPVYIDTGIDFSHDSLSMGAYAQIIVNPNSYLKIDTTKVMSACNDTMWNGITIDKNYTNWTLVRGSMINDAMVAIKASRDSKLEVSNSVFDDDEIGIHFYNNSNNSANPTFPKTEASNVWGSIFDSIYALLPPFNGIFRGYTGILLDTIQQITLGDTSAKGGNTFNHLLYGIVSYSSLPTVYGSNFLNITNHPFSPGLTSGTYIPLILTSNLSSTGTGIFAGVQQSDTSGFMLPAPNLGNNLTVGGNGNFQPDTFKSCNIGVDVAGATAKVNSCMFGLVTTLSKYVTNGIIASSSINRIYNFQNNKIYATKEGIKVAMPTSYSNNALSIVSNLIVDSGSKTFGIFGIDLMNMGTSLNVFSNITTHPNDTIKNNDIFLNRSGLIGNIYGISLVNCDSFDVTHNGIDTGLNGDAITPSLSFPYKRGIFLSMSTYDTVHCNALDHADFGFQAVDDWTGSVLLGNTFYKHRHAVMVGDSISPSSGTPGVVINQLGTVITGTNYTPGNLFKSHPTTEYHLYQYDPISGSKITYHTGIGESFSSYRVKLFLGHFDSLSLYTCSGSNILIDKKPNVNSSPNDDLPIDSFLINVIGNKYIFPTVFSNSMYFNLKSDVYNILNDNIELRNSNSIYEVFYDTASTGDIAKLTEVNALVSEISDSTFSSQVPDLISQAVSLNNSVQGQQTEENNLKVVNNILLNTLLGGIYDYTAVQRSQLFSIAEQCPYSGGRAVYQARAMIMLFNDTLNYDDEQICNISNQDLKNDKSIDRGSFIVYPNPTDGELHMAYSTIDFETYTIHIYDVTGKILYSQTFDGGIGNLSFNFSNYTPGVYFYNINPLQGETIKKGTFVIIK
jgi:hypothetical protein